MTLEKAVEVYLEAMKAQGYARRSVETYAPQLRLFVAWLAERGVERVAAVERTMIWEYREWQGQRRSRYDRPLTLRTQAQELSTLRRFFRFLIRREEVLVDPMATLETPRLPPITAPMNVPSVEQMERVLEMPNTKTAVGLRDRAVMEVLYASAIRNAELRALKVWDVDLVAGTLTVVRGKGGAGRIVPLGAIACDWVQQYLERVRPGRVRVKSETRLFLTHWGRPLGPVEILMAVRKYGQQAGLLHRLTVHAFRHACATHMLKAGADVRIIQQLLGHSKLTTTAIYTHLNLEYLKGVHLKCHPRARSE